MRSLKLSAASITALLAGAATPALAQYTLNTLGTFTGGNGANPYAGLTLSSDGTTLYGTTEGGGAYGGTVGAGGTVFSLPVTGGTPTALASFNGYDGANPYGDLTLVGNTLYGTTENGGSSTIRGVSGDGTAFSLPVTGGTPTTLAAFNGSNGAQPAAGLTVIGSTLYGTTSYEKLGGPFGSIFSVPITGGTPTSLASFPGGSNNVGYNPYCNLTLSSDGTTLYGTTSGGGASGDEGTVFSLPVAGGTPTTLGGFSGSNGYSPVGGLIRVGGTLYGMTARGGNLSLNSGEGVGTVFSEPITGGTPTILAAFDGSDGEFPVASLTLIDGMLYGTTEFGGEYGYGSVFSLPIGGGTPTTLFSFDGTDGANPMGDLISDASGDLYGTTESNGNDLSVNGTVFELVVPEPGSLSLLALGGLGLLARRRRRVVKN